MPRTSATEKSGRKAKIANCARRQEHPEHAGCRDSVEGGDRELAQHQPARRQIEHAAAEPGQRDPPSAAERSRPKTARVSIAAPAISRQRQPDQPVSDLADESAPMAAVDGEAGAEGAGNEDHHAGDVGWGQAERRIVAQADRAAAQRAESRGLGDRVSGHRGRRDAPPGLRLADGSEGVEIVESEKPRSSPRSIPRPLRGASARRGEQRLQDRLVAGLGRETRQREGSASPSIASVKTATRSDRRAAAHAKSPRSVPAVAAKSSFETTDPISDSSDIRSSARASEPAEL